MRFRLYSGLRPLVINCVVVSCACVRALRSRCVHVRTTQRSQPFASWSCRHHRPHHIVPPAAAALYLLRRRGWPSDAAASARTWNRCRQRGRKNRARKLPFAIKNAKYRNRWDRRGLDKTETYAVVGLQKKYSSSADQHFLSTRKVSRLYTLLLVCLPYNNNNRHFLRMR